MPFEFLSLPRELRIKVYEEVLLVPSKPLPRPEWNDGKCLWSTPIHFTPLEAILEIYTQELPLPHPAGKLLTTCRQIHDEIREDSRRLIAARKLENKVSCTSSAAEKIYCTWNTLPFAFLDMPRLDMDVKLYDPEGHIRLEMQGKEEDEEGEEEEEANFAESTVRNLLLVMKRYCLYGPRLSSTRSLSSCITVDEAVVNIVTEPISDGTTHHCTFKCQYFACRNLIEIVDGFVNVLAGLASEIIGSPEANSNILPGSIKKLTFSINGQPKESLNLAKLIQADLMRWEEDNFRVRPRF